MWATHSDSGRLAILIVWRVSLAEGDEAHTDQDHGQSDQRAPGDRFSDEDRRRIGVHTCPGGDQDSTHSADVDYADLLPLFFELHAGTFYLELAGEEEPEAALQTVARTVKPDQRVFVGVTDPIDPEVETPEQVRDRVLLAARYIPLDRLGTTDDCGFSPFADDASTARDTAFAKIRARVEGTKLAAERLGA